MQASEFSVASETSPKTWAIADNIWSVRARENGSLRFLATASEGRDGFAKAVRGWFTPQTVWENVGLATTVGPDEALGMMQNMAAMGIDSVRIESRAVAGANVLEQGALTALRHTLTRRGAGQKEQLLTVQAFLRVCDELVVSLLDVLREDVGRRKVQAGEGGTFVFQFAHGNKIEPRSPVADIPNARPAEQ